MSNIFDLTKVKKLMEKERPVCVVLLDTNVIMNYPSPDTWKMTVGPTIFIIPDGILIELEFLKGKTRKNEPNPQETSEKAIKAIKNITDLFCKGKIAEGIKTPGGWAITTPSPKQDNLKTELDQIQDIVKAFKPSDSKYLLLTKECDEQLPTPVIMTTGEYNLFCIAQANGIPFRLIKGFPMDTPIEVEEDVKEWTKSLKGMNSTAKQISLEVELTLLTNKSAPDYFMDGNKKVKIAEGQGIVKAQGINRPFLWIVTFNEMEFYQTAEESEKHFQNLPMVYLDFIAEGGGCEQELFDAIADRLSDCVNPSPLAGPITLLSPESIMRLLLIGLYKNEGKPIDKLIDEMDIDYLESEWLDFTVNKYDSEELIGIFQQFREATMRYWTIGESYKFRIMIDSRKK
jgi:hypothetical protein